MSTTDEELQFEKELQKVFFYKSYSDAKLWSQESLFPEVAFLGRSNSGKSSLINSLLNRKSLAKTSRTPGKTKLINVFAVPNQFSLVDLPGFGYSKASHSEHKAMMSILEDYLNYSQKISHLFVLLDSRRDVSEDETQFINTAINKNIPTTLIRTKSDKLNQKEKNKSIKATKSANCNFIYVSSLTNSGMNELRNILRLSVK
ncbi:MAG: YihA family ribosome biogenesis GTP-binding protein [Leptospira sp.]|nr:YihA family ribosome biogenesis GTP-binding protein [Leptospira sp.]